MTDFTLYRTLFCPGVLESPNDIKFIVFCEVLRRQKHMFKYCHLTAIVQVKKCKGDDFSVLRKYHTLYEAN